MPIDADAYMSGHIPTLSRGGSWVPPAHPGHPANGTIADPHPREAMFPTSSIHGSALGVFPPSWQCPPNGPFSARSVGGFAGPESAVSVYASAPLGNMSGWSPALAHPFMAPSMAAFTGISPSAHTPRTPTIISELPTRATRRTLPHSPYHDVSWEDGAGAPRRIPREQHYPLNGSPLVPSESAAKIIHRKRADSLPPPPSPELLIQTSNPIRPALSKDESLHKDERDRTASGSGKQLEARRNSFKRPSSKRASSYYHSPLATPSSPEKMDRSLAKDQARRSPPRMHAIARMPRVDVSKANSAQSSISSSAGTVPKSPYIKLGRPPAMRRHTSHHEYEKHESRSVGQSTAGSRQDRQSRLPQELSPSLPSRQSKVYDLFPLETALPPSPRFRTKADAPLGYISPTTIHEAYDRYSTHPAAPAPDRMDRMERHLQSSATSSSPNSPTDMILMGDAYLPVGYARPTKELEWNRDGPAMKTYGVAWKRHSDDLVLPKGPEGPRWVQARPPRVDVLSGGGWSQSGGRGV